MDYLFDKNSTWDIDNHIAIPKIQYIKEITGLDLIAGGFAIIGSIEAKVKQLTLNAKYKLFNNKSQRVKNALSYYIAYNQEYNNDWLVYASMYIHDMIINGEITNETKEAMQPLNIYGYTSGVLYDIENSGLEW